MHFDDLCITLEVIVINGGKSYMIFSREKLAPLVAELLGTFTLTYVMLSVSKSAIGIPYFVAIGAGLALTMIVLLVGSMSGAHVNPAVTFSMWAVRKIGTLKGLLYIAAQFIGAAFAWKLYTYLMQSDVQSIASPEFSWQIFTAEAVGTLVFVFGIAAAVYQKYEGGKLAATIGGSLIIGILIASVVANGALNPAVALGIQSWSPEYYIAPFVGGLIGVNLYALLFAGERIATPGKGRVSLPSKISFSSRSAKTTPKPAKKSVTNKTTKSKTKTRKRK